MDVKNSRRKECGDDDDDDDEWNLFFLFDSWHKESFVCLFVCC